MDGCGDKHVADVSFVEGKFGKCLPVVDSFVFYPKDKERIRFTCKTRGCNATINLAEDENGNIRVSGMPKHKHPNHEHVIKTLKHIQRLREEVKDPRNKYVQTKTLVSSVRNESKTCRRKSTDFRLARKIRMRGQHPRNAEDIVVTPTLAGNCIFISDDKGVIILAREWGIRLLCNAERICIDGTFRSAPVTHFQMLTFQSFARTGRRSPLSTPFSRTNATPLTSKCSTRYSDTQRSCALVPSSLGTHLLSQRTLRMASSRH